MAKQLKQQIVNGRFQPGEKLPSTKELSERFQVGRSSVREALSALKAMGLVDIRQGEGCYVRMINPADIDIPEFDGLLMNPQTVLELLEARMALEVANAAIAARKRTDSDLQTLADVLKKMESHLGDEKVGEMADIAFHQALAQATHNTIMVRLLETISSSMETAIRETRRLFMFADKSVSERLWNEHRAIVDAVANRDADLAQEKMKAHLVHVEQLLNRFYSNTSSPKKSLR